MAEVQQSNYQDECLYNSRNKIENTKKDHNEDLQKIKNSLESYLYKSGIDQGDTTNLATLLLKKDTLGPGITNHKGEPNVVGKVMLGIAGLDNAQNLTGTLRELHELKNDPWIKSLVDSYHKVQAINKKEMSELSDTTTEELTECLTEVENTDKGE